MEQSSSCDDCQLWVQYLLDLCGLGSGQGLLYDDCCGHGHFPCSQAQVQTPIQ